MKESWRTWLDLLGLSHPRKLGQGGGEQLKERPHRGVQPMSSDVPGWSRSKQWSHPSTAPQILPLQTNTPLTLVFI